MSNPATVVEQAEDSAVLGHLYARNKALALSVGAALTLRRRPVGARREVEEHLAECERAVAERRGAFSPHFAACRSAAAELAGLVREVERDLHMPSRQRLSAVRSSHRSLRRLVWEVFDCEYVPCGAHDAAHDREPDAMAVADSKGAHHG
jgi:hypothetical protein